MPSGRRVGYASVVSATVKQSTAQLAARAASQAFAENFAPEHPAAASTREAAAALGIDTVSPGTAAALSFLAAALNATAVVDIGTGAGTSGLALFQGMAPTGILTSIDIESEHQSAARKAFTLAGIPSQRFRLISGAALTVLPRLSDGAYDLVFIDGDVIEYVEYVAQAMRLLRHGGILVLNKAFAGDAVADAGNEDDETIIIREALAAIVETEEFRPLLVPLGSGLLAAVKS